MTTDLGTEAGLMDYVAKDWKTLMPAWMKLGENGLLESGVDPNGWLMEDCLYFGGLLKRKLYANIPASWGGIDASGRSE